MIPAKVFVPGLYLLVVIAFFMLNGCATTDGLQSDGSMKYTLTPEQVAQCAAEGGCYTISSAYEKELLRQAAKHFCGVDI